MIATVFGTGQVVYSILWFFLFFVEIWLMISVFIDVFRSHDLKGWAKAAWVVLVIVLPLIGILAYFIFRGDKMRAHQIQERQDLNRIYGNAADSNRSVVDDLSRLAELRREGVISEEEFQHLKSRVMSPGAAHEGPV
jgi:ABC-type multidrug transport system fused ATPase/permease subunit